MEHVEHGERRLPVTCSHCNQPFSFSDLGLVPQAHLPYIAVFLRCPHCLKRNPRRSSAKILRIAMRGVGIMLAVGVLSFALGQLWLLFAGALMAAFLIWMDQKSFERKITLYEATAKKLASH